jgi:hypothetical protein
VTFVDEGEHVPCLVGGGQDGNRGVREADAEIGVPLDDRPGLLDTLGA